MPLEIETRTNGAVAITRGPLNFAVDLAFNKTTAPGLRYVTFHIFPASIEGIDLDVGVPRP